MKVLNNIGELFGDIDRYSGRCLEFAMKYPDKKIPVYPCNKNSPEAAEMEARKIVENLRYIVLDGECAMPVFHICHVERDRIWCDFTLNPDFVRVLRRWNYE